MLKNAYFYEKTVKIVSASGAPPPNPRLPLAAGGFALRPPPCYSRLLLQLCQKFVFVLNAFYSAQK